MAIAAGWGPMQVQSEADQSAAAAQQGAGGYGMVRRARFGNEIWQTNRPNSPTLGPQPSRRKPPLRLRQHHPPALTPIRGRLRFRARRSAPAPAAAPAAAEQDPWASTSKANSRRSSPTTFGGQLWDLINSPLIDFHRRAPDRRDGLEDFVSGLTSPASVGPAVATFGSGRSKADW